MAVTIKILTTLDDRGVRNAQRAMSNLGSGAKGFSGSMGADLVRAGTALGRFGDRAVNTGKSLTFGVTLPVVAVGAAALKLGADFESSMKLIQTQAGGSAEDVKSLSASVLELAAKSQHGPQALAASLYHLKSVGMDNVVAMNALRVAEQGASVGGADLEATTNALAGAWRVGVKGGGDFTKTMGVLNAIIGAGNLRMEDLNDALGTGILTTVKTFGISLQSVGAGLAVLTSQGQPAAQSATRLRMAISMMGAPTSKAAKVLKDIGLSSTDLAAGLRRGGLVEAIGLLKDHMRGLSQIKQSQVLASAFGGAKAGGTIMALVQGYDALVAKQRQIVQNSGTFSKSVAAQAQDAEAKWHHFTSVLAVDAVKVSDVLLPVAMGIVEGLTSGVQAIGSLSGGMQTMVVKLAFGAAALGPAMIVFGMFAKLAGGAIKAVGNVSIAFSSMSAAAPLWARSIAGVAQSIGALTAAGRVGGIAAFASTLTAALGPVGLTVAAIAGAGGLIYGVARLSDELSGAADRARAMKTALSDLQGDKTGKLQAWADKALGGHLVSNRGSITWKPAVKMETNKTGVLANWVKTEAAKEHAIRVEALAQQKLDQARAAQAYFQGQQEMMLSKAAASGVRGAPGPDEVKQTAAYKAATAAAARYGAEVSRLSGNLGTLQGHDKALVIRANIKDAQRGIDVLQKKLDGYSKQPWSTSLQAKTDKAKARIAALRRYIASVTKGNHEILLQARVEGAQARIKMLQGVIKSIARSKASPEVKADRMKAAQDQLAKAKKALTALNAQRAKPVVKLVDQATDPANLLRQNLASTFATPITQTVVIKKVGAGDTGLARGAVFELNRATSFVAGEAGREIGAVFPLNDPTRAASLFADLQSRLGPHLPGRSSSRALSLGSSRGATTSSVVYVGPREVTIPIYLDGQLLTSYVLNLADELEAQQSRGEA